MKRQHGVALFSSLAELAQLKLLEDLRGAEEAGVDYAGDGEGASDDGAHGGEEVVERRPPLVVGDGDGVEVVPEPDGGNHAPAVTERDVVAVGVRVLGKRKTNLTLQVTLFFYKVKVSK